MENVQQTVQEASDDIKKRVENINNSDGIPEELKNNPSFIMYQKILETVTSMFDSEEIQNAVGQLANKMDKDTILVLLSIITTMSTTAAYHAVQLHHDIIVDEVNDAIGEIHNFLTEITADQTATKDSVVVLRKRLDDIVKDITINKISSTQ